MKKLLLGLLLATGALAPALAQTAPANDDPIAAAFLTYDPACANPVPGQLANATLTAPNGYQPVGCAGALAGDVWYRFGTPATGPASTGFAVSVVGAAAHEIRVFSTILGSAGPFVEVACSAGAAGAAAPTAFVAAAPSTPYYIKIGQRAGASGPAPFVVCVGVAPACGDPRNVAVTSIGGTSAFVSYGPGINNTSYVLTLVPTAGGPTQTFATANTTGYGLTGLTPLTAYTLTIQGICAAGGNGALITRTFTTTTDNDDPLGAVLLTAAPLGAACAPTQGTTTGATPSHALGAYPTRIQALNVDLSYQNDVWFKLASPASGIILEVTVTGAPANVLRLFNYVNNFPPTNYYSTLGSGPQAGTLNTGATTAQALRFTSRDVNLGEPFVYLSVATATALVPGPFTICVREVAANTCDDFLFPAQGQLGVRNETATSVDFDFSLAIPITYRLTATPVNGGPVVVANNVTTFPYRLTSLQPATRYRLELVRICTSGVASSPIFIECFTLSPGPPPNDNCANALPLACGQTVQGTALRATIEVTDPRRCVPSTFYNNQVWYTLVGQGVPMTLNACDAYTVSQPEIEVFEGSCGSLQCVAQTASTTPPCRFAILNPSFGTVSFPTVAGQVYYVAVYRTSTNLSTGGDAGNFGLTLARAAGACAAPCLPPTALAVSALTATSAILGFAPGGGGATAYTATATPAGGGVPVTVSGPASPLALVGLTPNTAYNISVTAACAPPAVSAPSAALAIRTPLAGRGAALAALAALVGLYPNPAHRAATLTLPAEASRVAGQVRLLDALGRLARAVPLPAGTTRLALDLAGLPAGIYTVQVLAGSLALAKRLVVE